MHPFRKVRFILFLTLVVCGFSAYSQTIQVVVNNPSPYVSDWAQHSTTAMLIIANPGKGIIKAKISSQLYDGSNLVASTDNKKMQVISIDPGTTQYYAEDIIPQNAVNYYGKYNTDAIARTGELPAGQWHICVQLVDPNTGAALTPQQPQCAYFTIMQYSQPTLISPLNNSTIICSDVRRPEFLWTPVQPAYTGGIVTYRLQVMEMLAGQEAGQAFRTNKPILVEDYKNRTNVSWPVDVQLPDTGMSYVWSVQALDADERPIGDNKGSSGYFSFKSIGENPQIKPLALTLLLPANGEMIDSNKTPTFKWQYDGTATDNHYTLKVVEVKEGQSAVKALKTNIPVLIQENMKTTSFRNSDTSWLKTGHNYAWEVAVYSGTQQLPVGSSAGFTFPCCIIVVPIDPCQPYFDCGSLVTTCPGKSAQITGNLGFYTSFQGVYANSTCSGSAMTTTKYKLTYGANGAFTIRIFGASGLLTAGLKHFSLKTNNNVITCGGTKCISFDVQVGPAASTFTLPGTICLGETIPLSATPAAIDVFVSGGNCNSYGSDGVFGGSPSNPVTVVVNGWPPFSTTYSFTPINVSPPNYVITYTPSISVYIPPDPNDPTAPCLPDNICSCTGTPVSHSTTVKNPTPEAVQVCDPIPGGDICAGYSKRFHIRPSSELCHNGNYDPIFPVGTTFQYMIKKSTTALPNPNIPPASPNVLPFPAINPCSPSLVNGQWYTIPNDYYDNTTASTPTNLPITLPGELYYVVCYIKPPAATCVSANSNGIATFCTPFQVFPASTAPPIPAVVCSPTITPIFSPPTDYHQCCNKMFNLKKNNCAGAVINGTGFIYNWIIMKKPGGPPSPLHPNCIEDVVDVYPTNIGNCPATYPSMILNKWYRFGNSVYTLDAPALPALPSGEDYYVGCYVEVPCINTTNSSNFATLQKFDVLLPGAPPIPTVSTNPAFTGTNPQIVNICGGGLTATLTVPPGPNYTWTYSTVPPSSTTDNIITITGTSGGDVLKVTANYTGTPYNNINGCSVTSIPTDVDWCNFSITIPPVVSCVGRDPLGHNIYDISFLIVDNSGGGCGYGGAGFNVSLGTAAGTGSPTACLGSGIPISSAFTALSDATGVDVTFTLTNGVNGSQCQKIIHVTVIPCPP